jgi:hypothetical protein
MKTAFCQVVDAVIAALAADPAVCDTIFRARPNVVPDQTEQAINVQWEGAVPDRGVIHGAPVDWQTRISVEAFARSVRDAGDIAVDPLLASIYERLALDPSLGGITADFDGPVIEAENTAQGNKTGWVRLTYIARHQTRNNNLAGT